MGHKRYFREPSMSGLEREYVTTDLVDRISKIEEGKILVISRKLIPSEFYNPRFIDDSNVSWHFLRHGDRIAPTPKETISGIFHRKSNPLNLLEVAAVCKKSTIHWA